MALSFFAPNALCHLRNRMEKPCSHAQPILWKPSLVFLNELSARTMRGGEPSREEILYLLETPPDSPQSELMRKKAQEMAIELTGNTGRVWSAVGIDRRSCPMNCEFCSFGEKWGLIKDRVRMAG